MDFHLKGHPYAKSAIDMACWDLLGKKAQLPSPLARRPPWDRVDLYRSIAQDTPARMVARRAPTGRKATGVCRSRVGLDPTRTPSASNRSALH